MFYQKSNDSCVKLRWSVMDHEFNLWCPPSLLQEFSNWICAWSRSLKGCSIRFLDDWWTWFIESQLLYSQWANWVTLWANWLLCYGMHDRQATWTPGRLSQTAIWYHVAPMKHLMAVLSLQETARSPRRPWLFRSRASQSGAYNKSGLSVQGGMTQQYLRAGTGKIF